MGNGASDRLPGVEGLRALAAAGVLAHHVPLIARKPGATVDFAGPLDRVLVDLRWGLTLFFALSGFLLFRPFAAAVVDGRALPSIRRYARNRALRILPAYWAILLVSSFVLGTTVIYEGDGIGPLTDAGVLVANLLLVQNYRPEWALTGIGPAWSLAVELVFYVVLPVLAIVAAALAARSGDARARIAAAFGAGLALVVVGLAGKAIFAAGVTDSTGERNVVATLMPVHADLFGYGMLAAVVHVLAVQRRVALPAGWRPVAFAVAAGLILLAAAASRRLDVAEAGEYGDCVVGVACGLILLGVCVPAERRTVVQRLLELRPVVWLGLISYSVYLWHVPLLIWLRERGFTVSGDKSLVVVGLAAAIATLVASALTWRLVESPALARKGRRPALAEAEAEPSRQVV